MRLFMFIALVFISVIAYAGGFAGGGFAPEPNITGDLDVGGDVTVTGTITGLGTGITDIQSAGINWTDVDAQEIQAAGINWTDTTAATVVTNANLTGPITSVGNATAIAGSGIQGAGINWTSVTGGGVNWEDVTGL